jgi:hypothetical protein
MDNNIGSIDTIYTRSNDETIIESESEKKIHDIENNIIDSLTFTLLHNNEKTCKPPPLLVYLCYFFVLASLVTLIVILTVNYL